VREYLESTLSTLFSPVTYAPDQGITFGTSSAQSEALRRRFIASVKSAQPGQLNAAQQLYGATPGQDANLASSTTDALPQLVEYLSSVVVDEYTPHVLDERGEVTLGQDGKPVRRPRAENEKRAAAIVERLDLIAPPDEAARLSDPQKALLALLHRVGTDRALDERSSLLVMLAPTLEHIHPDLRSASSGVRAINVPLPSVDTRAAYIERIMAGDERRPALELEMTVADLAAQTAGLTLRNIEDIALRAHASGHVVTRELVKARKSELMASEYAEVLEQLEPDVTLDMVAGHELALDFIWDRVITPATSNDPSTRARMPKGVVFTGPPGTGKTFTARAITHALDGWNIVALRGDKLLNSLLGESEKRLAKAIAGIEAFAPVVVLIDELDQTMPRRQGGGAGGGGEAVQGNLFGRLLEFFSEPSHTGRIFCLGMTNYPNIVDAALFRPGRFDWKIPLLPPATPVERADVARVLLERRGIAELPSCLELLGERTQNYTQAELEQLVDEGLALRDISRTAARPGRAARVELTLDAALLQALEDLRPSTTRIQEMTDLALSFCANARVVPEAYRAGVGKDVPDYQPTPPPAAQPRGRAARAGDDFELE
jgi:transitional endoplasmic reticulum ATPase